MITANPDEMFEGKILIIVPHMDDEALACGGIIAKFTQKDQIYLIYATDGMKSPAPIVPRTDSISPDLGEIRVSESISAMDHLGVPEKNLSFLRLPEGQLREYSSTLREMLLKKIEEIHPSTLFIPFRYDRHPDHLIINQIVVNALKQELFQAKIIEYFVYYRSRLLPLRDIRKYIDSRHMIKVDIDDVANEKRTALDCFKSQTTRFYSWQTRPILTPVLLDEECQNPEYFLRYDPTFPDSKVFTKAVLWIRIAHRIEPHLQKWKYLTVSSIKRLINSGI